MTSYDVIVVGTGGVGTGALFHLASRGLRVLGLDRFGAVHASGSSHGRTRMIRRAYFEHPDYVPMCHRAFRLWSDLEHRTGRQLFFPVGLLQVGPGDGAVLSGVRASAQAHGLAVEELSASEIHSRFAGFHVPDHLTGLFERDAGYLRVEDCVQAHLDEATRLGAVARWNEPVRSWTADNRGVVVETDQGRYTAAKLVITAGAWSAQLLADLGIGLEVRRKPTYWYPTKCDAYRPERGMPAFLFESPEGLFYGFPEVDPEGIKVAEHSGGRIVDDPTHVDREIDTADQTRVEDFLRRYLTEVDTRCALHSVCMYTMTADQHFVVDRHPEFPSVTFAAGLSGHGFKFAGVLGEVLADLTSDVQPTLPVEFLRCNRPGLRAASRNQDRG